MDKLLLSALTLSCLSLAFVYLSTQELGEHEAVAFQAAERTHQLSAEDAKRTSTHRPDPQNSAPTEVYPWRLEPTPQIFQI